MDSDSEYDRNDENQEPNLRYRSPNLNDSVVRVSDMRQSYQISEIFGASSRHGDSPMRASDIFNRKEGDDEVLRSIDFK